MSAAPNTNGAPSGSLMWIRKWIRDPFTGLREAGFEGAKTGGLIALAVALIFNPKGQRAGRRLSQRLRAQGTRIVETATNELRDALVIGYGLMELKWVGLAIFGFLIHWLIPYGWWTPVAIFAFGLRLKHKEKAYMIARLPGLMIGSAFYGFVQGAFEDRGDKSGPWQRLSHALRRAGAELPVNNWLFMRKMFNENGYYTVALVINCLPLHALPMLWLFYPLMAFCALYTWEANMTIGNDMTGNGGQVVTAETFDMLVREKQVDGGFKFVVKPSEGRKFRLPFVQTMLRNGAAAIITLVPLVSCGYFAYRLNDADLDGLSNKQERRIYNTQPDRWDSRIKGISDKEAVLDTDSDGVPNIMELAFYKTNPNNADTDGDAILDGDEIKLGLNPHGTGSIIDTPPKEKLFGLSIQRPIAGSGFAIEWGKAQYFLHNLWVSFVRAPGGELISVIISLMFFGILVWGVVFVSRRWPWPLAALATAIPAWILAKVNEAEMYFVLWWALMLVFFLVAKFAIKKVHSHAAAEASGH